MFGVTLIKIAPIAIALAPRPTASAKRYYLRFRHDFELVLRCFYVVF